MSNIYNFRDTVRKVKEKNPTAFKVLNVIKKCAGHALHLKDLLEFFSFF